MYCALLELTRGHGVDVAAESKPLQVVEKVVGNPAKDGKAAEKPYVLVSEVQILEIPKG